MQEQHCFLSLFDDADADANANDDDDDDESNRKGDCRDVSWRYRVLMRDLHERQTAAHCEISSQSVSFWKISERSSMGRSDDHDLRNNGSAAAIVNYDWIENNKP